MMVADTSFIIPIFRKEDAHYRKAGEALISMKDDIVVPDTVLFEALTVLNIRCGIDIVKEAYKKIMENPQISIAYFGDNEREAIWGEFLSHMGKISTVDASVIFLAKKNGCGILSYDEDLNKAAKAYPAERHNGI